MGFLEDFVVGESLFIKYNYEPNGLSIYTIYVKNRKVFLRATRGARRPFFVSSTINCIVRFFQNLSTFLGCWY